MNIISRKREKSYIVSSKQRPVNEREEEII